MTVEAEFISFCRQFFFDHPNTCRNLTTAQILLAGERIWNLARLFNLKAGIDKSQDTLPKRLLSIPIPDGPAAGQLHRLDEMLPEYYQLRGWDADGVPTDEKLTELGLN